MSSNRGLRPPVRRHPLALKKAARWTLLAGICLLPSVAPGAQGSPPKITKAAAETCRTKVEKLQTFAEKAKPGKKQVTRLSQEEINSYLALDLSAKYSPGLKSLVFAFEEDKLQADAIIDFDRLGMSAARVITKLMASLFSGTHTLSVRGTLIAQQKKAKFQLEEAKFDGTGLPNFLVEEIITAVGRKQRPPFDPIQPTEMPYRIEKVEIHSGYIVVYQ